MMSQDNESMVFHRDSGSGHIARGTIQFLKNNNVRKMDAEASGAASMDFGMWGILKRLYKCGMSTLRALVILTSLKG